MEIPITKADWETNKFNNEVLIKTNLMQIEMAEKIIDLCDEKIKEFTEEEKKETSLKEEDI
ncbi:MAG: hypothetical protein M0R35_07090 [Candidatus Omnitrophica bacterium]|jgi:hypothetical protein|nr:hypothetical protein [Candidatus Omnitrophota bacterium]